MKRIIAVWLVMLIVMGGMVGIVNLSTDADDGNGDAGTGSASQPKSGLTTHDSIYINSNSEFIEANGVTGGSGTEFDPYIIEGWDINASSANGIEIRTTDKYFIIRNCVVHDGWTGSWGASHHGIYFYNVQNGKIDNVTTHNNYYGIYLDFCSNNNLISNNQIYNNSYGIQLWYSSNNILKNNILENNTYNFGVWGSYVWGNYNQDIDTSNTINGKLIHYITEQSDLVFDSIEVGYLAFVSCSNILVKNLTLVDNIQGLLLANTSYSIITANQIYNNSDGISLHSSSYNNISANQIHNNSGDGIELYYSSNNILRNNVLEDNTYNFDVWGEDISDFYHDIDTSNTINGKP
ncbi:MAG: right-handed parallel beta-helix repeat-containing protein, partial [Candidatus Thermoplasmatota archaeon]|nr:right-handed parallel beta-helix repeat-containing protein [Candidatus Thermoplasmatota archaeon]